jgi:hypothetical protein
VLNACIYIARCLPQPEDSERFVWNMNCVQPGMIERCLLILLSLTLIGSVGGFFLYVPILPNLAVAVMLGALCAIFWLGVRVGRRAEGATISRQAAVEGSQLSLS